DIDLHQCFRVNHAGKSMKQVERIVGSRGCFGVKLDAERLLRRSSQTLAGLVVQVDVGRLDSGRKRGEVDAEAVVLRRDLHAPRRDVLDRLIRAAMTELELVGLRAESERENLVPETDAEDRFFSEEPADRFD